MPAIVNLEQHQFISQEAFKNLYPDGYLDEVSNGIISEQIVPKIYLSKNNVIINGTLLSEADSNNDKFDVFSMTWHSLIVMSYSKEIVFLIQQYNSRIERQFNHKDSCYYPFLTVSREHINKYEKLGEGEFLAVKPKKTINFAIDAARKGIGRGLIPGLIMKGVVGVLDKNEDDFDMRRGTKFRLYFKNRFEEDYVDIVSHPSATDRVDNFLKLNWKNTEPLPVASDKKKEGCYIATCCYGSYEHSSVLKLRRFRDKTLLTNRFGKAFVSVYYRFSPKIADKLAKRPVINSMVKVLFLEPIIFMVSLINYRS